MDPLKHRVRRVDRGPLLKAACIIALFTTAVCLAAAPNAPEEKPHGMIVAPSPKTPRSTWPRAVPEYLFTVRSHGGATAGPGIDEYDWRLEVDSRLGLASLESFRSDGDEPGAPIGIFRLPLSDAQLREFRQTLTEARLDKVTAQLTGHGSTTLREFALSEPGQPPVRVVLNDFDHRGNAQLGVLNAAVTTLLSAALKHPERAVRASAAPAREGQGLELTLRNIGVEPVCLADPLSLGAAGEFHRAVVRVAEYTAPPPGDPGPALQWREEPLSPKAAPPKTLTLAPGEAWTQIVPLVRDLARQHLVSFTWAHYAGEATAAGRSCLRGRLDSNRLLLKAR